MNARDSLIRIERSLLPSRTASNSVVWVGSWRRRASGETALREQILDVTKASQRYLKFQDGGASRCVGYPRMVETRRVWLSLQAISLRKVGPCSML